MYKNTHPVEAFITFDDSFKNCFSNMDMLRAYKNITINHLIIAVSLATGLEMKYVGSIKWKELLILGTENNAIVHDELRVRKYYIPIHPKLKFLISETYCSLGYPNVEIEIINTIPNMRKSNAEWMLRGVNNTYNEIQKIDRKHMDAFNFDSYSQILFGRKVFEVNGYTNDICKFLKLHFKFRSNKELFFFLGYKAKDEIKFELRNINLDAIGVFIQLEDKNFTAGFPFQKFTAFSKFLLSEIRAYKSPVINSVRLLLLISLYNGIRPSKLLGLKWRDIIQIDEEVKKPAQIKKKIIFDNQIIKINKGFESSLLTHFVYTMDKSTDIARFYSKGWFYPEDSNFDSSVFVTNRYNSLTQPSLSREIKKALQNLRFPHAEHLTSNSTVIMYGRRIMEIKGDHKPTIKKLKEHFKFKSKKELFDFLYLTGSREKEKEIYNFKGKVRKNIFEGILYDF
jgi:integrase